MECLERKIPKELEVYNDRQTVEYSFLPAIKIKPTSQSSWCTKHPQLNQLEQRLRKTK